MRSVKRGDGVGDLLSGLDRLALRRPPRCWGEACVCRWRTARSFSPPHFAFAREAENYGVASDTFGAVRIIYCGCERETGIVRSTDGRMPTACRSPPSTRQALQMTRPRTVSAVTFVLFSCAIMVAAPSQADARYTGSGPACVSGVNQLPVYQGKSRGSRVLGYLSSGQCGMNIESVEGAWTYIRGSSRGRNLQGWVRNRFLRAKGGTTAPNGNEETNVASARSCRRFGRLRSRTSEFPISIRFINQTRGQRTVMWLDFRGQPKEYKRLAPGQSYVQQTFAGHPWMFTDGPGNCKELFVPTRNTRRYVISFDR